MFYDMKFHNFLVLNFPHIVLNIYLNLTFEILYLAFLKIIFVKIVIHIINLIFQNINIDLNLNMIHLYYFY